MKKSPIRTFCRHEHLKRRNDIREVFNRGKRYYEPGNDRGAVLYVLKTNHPYNRICFSFTKTGSRSFGSAVARNRAKRLCREAYRLLKDDSGGHDFILIINPVPGISFSDRMEQLRILFNKAGLFK